MHIKVFSLLACSVALGACGQSSNAPGGPPGAAGMGAGAARQSTLTVEVTQPKQAQTAQVLDTSGALYAWQEVAIGSEVSGYRVSEVLVDVGEAVKKGQVLARLDETLLRESFNQAQAAVNVARATMEQAQAAARRGNALQTPGVISKQDAEQLNTTAATAAAQLTSAESLLEAARQRLEYTSIKSPDDGVISARAIVPGQIANSGTTLFSLIRQSRVEWRAEVPASEIGKVRRGMNASIKRADGTLATGKVRTVSPGLDANTQRGTAYIDLQLKAQVRPGMYVSGSIELAKSDSLTVPLASVTVRDGFSYVFVLNADNSVRQQRVEVNRLLSDSVELTSGITTADRIVASGAGLLRDGDRVQTAGTDGNASEPASKQANTQAAVERANSNQSSLAKATP